MCSNVKGIKEKAIVSGKIHTEQNIQYIPKHFEVII